MAPVDRRKSVIKPLSKELKDKVRSECTIANLVQCVEELVYNSIDAGATKVVVGVNMRAFNVEVVDNGRGMFKEDMEVVGRRNVTSKCTREDDLRDLQFYGYRGEALASIIEVSSVVKLISHPADIERKVFRRCFRNGKATDSGVQEVKGNEMPKPGLMVMVEGLLERYPVRQGRIDPTLQMEDIKCALEGIALINPAINIEFRDDINLSTLLKYKACFSHADAFDQLFSTKKMSHFQFVSQNHLQDGILFTASIGRYTFRLKCFQFVFVNRRLIQGRMKIHKVLNNLLARVFSACEEGTKGSQKDQFPVFILNLTSSMDKYGPQRDTTFSVEFWDWEGVAKGLEGLVLKFQRSVFPSAPAVDLGVSGTMVNSLPLVGKQSKGKADALPTRKESLGRIHGFIGAVHSRVISRDVVEKASPSPTRKSKVQQQTHSQDSFSAASISYSDIEDSPSMCKPQPFLPVKKSTAKHTVYNVRRSWPKAKAKQERPVVQSGKPRKDIVVPKKPVLTKNIFDRFPEWKSTNTKTYKKKAAQALFHDSDSDGDSTTVMPVADRKISYKPFTYMPPGKFPTVVRRVTVGPESLSPNQALTRLGEHEAEGFDWKISRFVKDTMANCSKRHLIEDNDVKSKRSRFSFSPLPQEKELNKKNEHSVAPPRPCSSASGHSSTKKAPASVGISDDDDECQGQKSIGAVGLQVLEGLRTSAQKFLESKKLTGLTEDVETVLRKDFSLCLAKSHFEVSGAGGHEIDGRPTAATPDPYGLAKAIRVDSQKQGVGLDNDMNWGQWELDIVTDNQGREWLQQTENGRPIFICLATGEMSLDMVNVIKRTRTTAARLTSSHYEARNWLQRYFPKGCEVLWRRDASDRKPLINGVMCAATTHLSETVKAAIGKTAEESQDNHTKWHQETWTMASEFFVDATGEESEYFIKPVAPENASTDSSFLVPKRMTKSMTFKKEDLQRIRVVGTWDRKFILATLSIADFDVQLGEGSKITKDILVVLDQHAVHERVRLEKLLTDIYETDQLTGHRRILGSRLDAPYLLSVSDTEARIVSRYREAFRRIGMEVEVPNHSSVKVLGAPTCLVKKASLEANMGDRTTSLRNMLVSLVQEEANRILETKVATGATIPRTIFTILCSQACRGAIKFGDELSASDCENLITELKQCKTPFQCAHGRPSIVPLLDLSSLQGGVKTIGNCQSCNANQQTVPPTIPHESRSLNTYSRYGPPVEVQSVYFDLPTSE